MPGVGHPGFRAEGQICGGITPQLSHIIRAEIRAFSGLGTTPEEVGDEIGADSGADTGAFARSSTRLTRCFRMGGGARRASELLSHTSPFP